MPGVPSTLNELVFDRNNQPLLRPFPSLSANRVEQGGFAYIQSMEIDPLGRMWLLDSGSQNQASGPFVWGPPRIVILDLRGGAASQLLEYLLPFPVALPSGSMTFLNDIVLDWRNDLAYISLSIDAGGILFFDARRLRSSRMTGAPTGVTQPQLLTADYCGLANLTLGPTPSDGIALSPDGRTLYYCPLVGHTLYRLPTAAFREDPSQPLLSTDRVEVVGEKAGMSDGMAMTSGGALYYGNLESCALNRWDTSSAFPPAGQQEQVLQSAEKFNWIDTFAFDGEGGLLFTSNRLSFFFADQMDFSGSSGPNFRIWTLDLNVYSYMSPANPLLPFSLPLVLISLFLIY